MSGVEHPVATVLVAPEPTADKPGRPQHLADPNATRIIRIATTHATEWGWRRLTGYPAEIPEQFSDLSAWRPQPLWQVAAVLGHAP